MKNQDASRVTVELEDEITCFENKILEDIGVVRDAMRLYELMNRVRWKCQMLVIKYPDKKPRILEVKKGLLDKLGDVYWML